MTNIDLNNLPVVRIRWVDTLERHGWASTDDASRPEGVTISSVAYLLGSPTREDPWYTIVRDVAAEQGIVCGTMRIPSIVVLSCSVLIGADEPAPDPTPRTASAKTSTGLRANTFAAKVLDFLRANAGPHKAREVAARFGVRTIKANNALNYLAVTRKDQPVRRRNGAYSYVGDDALPATPASDMLPPWVIGEPVSPRGRKKTTKKKARTSRRKSKRAVVAAAKTS